MTTQYGQLGCISFSRRRLNCYRQQRRSRRVPPRRGFLPKGRERTCVVVVVRWATIRLRVKTPYTRSRPRRSQPLRSQPLRNRPPRSRPPRNQRRSRPPRRLSIHRLGETGYPERERSVIQVHHLMSFNIFRCKVII